MGSESRVGVDGFCEEAVDHVLGPLASTGVAGVTTVLGMITLSELTRREAL